MKLSDLVLLLVAAIPGLFGLIIVVGAALGRSEENSLLGHLLLTLLFGIGPIVFAALLVWFVWRRIVRRRREALERMILGLSTTHGGRLTPLRVAQGSELTLAEAQAVLEDMQRSAHCRLEVDAEGTMVYCFGPVTPSPPVPPPALEAGG